MSEQQQAEYPDRIEVPIPVDQAPPVAIAVTPENAQIASADRPQSG